MNCVRMRPKIVSNTNYAFQQLRETKGQTCASEYVRGLLKAVLANCKIFASGPFTKRALFKVVALRNCYARLELALSSEQLIKMSNHLHLRQLSDNYLTGTNTLKQCRIQCVPPSTPAPRHPITYPSYAA